MKRLHPLFLAALCWILVALVPASRSGFWRAAKDASLSQSDASLNETSTAFENEALRRFPHDRRVQLDALSQATGYLADPDQKKNQRRIDALGAQLGDDPVAIALLLNSRLDKLKQNRNEGPLTNPNRNGAAPPHKPGDMSPPADWNAFLALARRGQHLEPQNSYFSWMMLYGLFATRRDDEARAILKIGAHQPQYDDHGRDMVLNRLAVTRLMHGSPISVLDSFTAIDTNPFGPLGKIRQTTRWATEAAIADREAGRHQRALDTAFGILQMGRTMRRNSYSLINSLVANAVEQIPLKRLLSPATVHAPLAPMPVGTRSPRLYFQQDSLYYYAQNHGRTDITRFINRESPELAQWRKLGPVITSGLYDWTGNTPKQMVMLVAGGKARALMLRALPWILGLGAFFTLLSRRGRDEAGESVGGFWRGALATGVLLGATMVLDAIIALREDDAASVSTVFAQDSLFTYLEGQGVLSKSPSWAAPGWSLALVLVAIGAAVGWQKRQVAPPVGLKTRLKTAFEAPEDGLTRFDFGWLGRLIALGTGWLLLFGAFAALSFGFAAAEVWLSFESASIGAALLGAAVLISLVFHFAAWRHTPGRRRALRVGWRLISQALLGGFAALSVFYALIAFAFLPLSLRYDLNFQNAMERGEIQIARAKLGF